jgi:hypothetical protein
VASFSLVSYQQLQPSSSDTTNLLLSQISQQLSALSNGTLTSASLSLPNQPSFRPTASAIRVNTLWFSSLALSLVSAVWVTFVQQWARRYLLAVNRPYNPSKRARIRAFFADGVEKFGLQTAIEILPSFMRFSILLFFIGLVDFLLNLDRIVGLTLLSLFAVAALIYILLTIMPLRYHNSPFRTSLSALIWFIIEVAPLLKLWLRRRTDFVQNAIRERQHKIRRGMSFAFEKQADKQTSQADARALRWTLVSLDQDHELEDFLDRLPGLFHGTARNVLGIKPELELLVMPVADKLFATCSAGLLPEGIRRKRLTACLGAIWCFPNTIDRHLRAIRDQWIQPTNDPWGPLSIETWAVATNLIDDPDPITAIRAHCVQALIAAMWVNGKWQCPTSEAFSVLQRQLAAPSVYMDMWHQREGHLQLAVAANLLSHVLPLLRQLETGPDISFKIDIKAILDLICGELDATEVSEDLQARFPSGSEVMEVFNIEGLPRSFRRTCH